MGSNTHGQLGTKDFDNKNKPQLVDGLQNSQVKAVECGGNQTFVLLDNGDCFSFGQAIASGLDHDSCTPTQIATNITSVSSGLQHTALIDTRGCVLVCGINQFGQLGVEQPQITVPVQMPHFSDCAKQVACGDHHTLVLSISGLVYACGKGDRGQLGLNSTENHDMLQIVESISKATIKQVAAGSFSAALSENSLWVWGNQHLQPYKLKGVKIDQISVGSSMAVGIGKHVYTWDEHLQQTDLPLCDIQQVSCGSNFAIALGRTTIHQVKEKEKENRSVERMDNLMMKLGSQPDRVCCQGHQGDRRPYKPKPCNCEDRHLHLYKLYKAKQEKKYQRLLDEQKLKLKQDYKKKRQLMKGQLKIEFDVQMQQIQDRLRDEYYQQKQLVELQLHEQFQSQKQELQKQFEQEHLNYENQWKQRVQLCEQELGQQLQHQIGLNQQLQIQYDSQVQFYQRDLCQVESDFKESLAQLEQQYNQQRDLQQQEHTTQLDAQYQQYLDEKRVSSKLQSQLQSLQDELLALNDRVGQLQSECAKYQDSLVNYDSLKWQVERLERTESQNKRLLGQQKEDQELISGLQSKVQQLQRDKLVLKGQVDSHSEIVRGLEHEVEQQASRAAFKQSEYQMQLEEEQNRAKEAMGRVQEGVVKLNQCKELLQAEVERRSELQTNLARVIFELSQAQSGLAQLKFDKENADRVSQGLKESFQKDLEALKGQVMQKDQCIKQLRVMLDEQTQQKTCVRHSPVKPCVKHSPVKPCVKHSPIKFSPMKHSCSPIRITIPLPEQHSPLRHSPVRHAFNRVCAQLAAASPKQSTSHSEILSVQAISKSDQITQSLGDLKQRIERMKRNTYIVDQPSGISLFKQ